MSYEPITKDDVLVAQVWEIMQRHKGFAQRIDREKLTLQVFDRVTANNDRKVRDALAELPVVWQDGYYIPVSEAEAEVYVMSMKSRQVRIAQRLSLLNRYLREQQSPARQMKLDEALR